MLELNKIVSIAQIIIFDKTFPEVHYSHQKKIYCKMLSNLNVINSFLKYRTINILNLVHRY